MSLELLPPEAARLITPRSLTGYARGLGWQPVPNGKRSDIAVFHRPDSRLHQVIIPTDPGLTDYSEVVIEAVRTLSAYERRPAREVFEQLLLPPADVLRFREVSPASEAGSLPLDHAVQCILGARNTFRSVAHSVLMPQPYHPRMSRSEAEGFVSRCSLCQTERGSFVLTVGCPLDVEIGLYGPNEKPFARRVTELLLQTLHGLSKAPDIVHPNELADTALFPGISANLCESLLMLRPDGDRAYVGVSATWSRTLLPPEQEPRQEVQLRQESFDVAEALARQLRSLPSPRVDRFYGVVDELRGGPGLIGIHPAGEVRFSLFDLQGEIRAKGDLNVDQYAEALAAHAANDLVSFKGQLRRLPRVHSIDGITDFQRVHLDHNGLSGKESPGNGQ